MVGPHIALLPEEGERLAYWLQIFAMREVVNGLRRRSSLIEQEFEKLTR